MRKAPYFICENHENALEEMEKRNSEIKMRLKEENITVIPNGIDLETFRPSSVKKSLDYSIVTTASADIPLKGLRHLILAMPRVIRKCPSTSLTVIGKAPKKSKLNKLIDDLNLKDRVTFKSGMTEEEIVNIYHTSDIAVIPSLYEGFGFGAGEAMACGIPHRGTFFPNK